MDYEELFQPYTSDGHTLKATVVYLKKIAAGNRIPDGVVDEAIKDVFLRVSLGEEFPLDKCPCGCGIDKAGTAITHAMRDRMFEIVHDRVQLYYLAVSRQQKEQFDIEGDMFDLLNLVYEKIDAQRDRTERQKQFKRNRSALRHPIKVCWPKIKAAFTKHILWK